MRNSYGRGRTSVLFVVFVSALSTWASIATHAKAPVEGDCSGQGLVLSAGARLVVKPKSAVSIRLAPFFGDQKTDQKPDELSDVRAGP